MKKIEKYNKSLLVNHYYCESCGKIHLFDRYYDPTYRTLIKEVEYNNYYTRKICNSKYYICKFCFVNNPKDYNHNYKQYLYG